jgi:hypothetical protein
MGAWGAIIMSFFGALFAALTLYWQWQVSGAALASPYIAFAALGLAAVHVLRLPGEGIVPSARAQKAFLWSSTAEGIGLFLAANIMINLHRPDLLLPAMALVVGLHFLPIAIAARFPPFHALGAAWILAAALGFVLPAPVGGEIAGFMGALSLWAAAAMAVRREWQAKRTTAPAA